MANANTKLSPQVTKENKMNAQKQENPVAVSASEALYGFMGWLTTRAEVVSFGGSEDAAIAAELVDEYCKANSLVEPREGWTDYVTHPPKSA